MDTPFHVTDTNGTRYELTRSLGRGGQGEVFAVKNNRLAAKLLRRQTPLARERLRNQLARVKRLDLSGVAIARPIVTLREPAVGYIMQLLSDCEPLENWIQPPRETGSLLDWYAATGGLKVRLELAAWTAEVLSLLHGKGLAFTDLSPNNVLVNRDDTGGRVTLIDADNLVYESAAGTKVVFTPGFGAPELLLGQSGASSLTDAHSFAVIAYQLLTMRHPLIGDLVDAGDPDLEQQALQGMLPWVEDLDDKSNHSSQGLPTSAVISPKVSKLFHKAFGPGLRDPLLRPGTAEWADRLWSAADVTLRCPNCEWTYYYDEAECPRCDAGRPAYVRVDVCIWDPEAGAEGTAGDLLRRPAKDGKLHLVSVSHCLVAKGQSRTLTRRQAFGASSATSGESVLAVSVDDSRVSLATLDGGRYRLVTSGNKRSAVIEANEASLVLDSRPSRLHFGPDDEIHRVAFLRFVDSAQR